jgi:hypothetical protein
MPHSYAEDSLAKYRRSNSPVGKQWLSSADDPALSSVKTSTQWAAGRGFQGDAAAPAQVLMRGLSEDDVQQVMARMKLTNTVGIRACGCSLDAPSHSPADHR